MRRSKQLMALSLAVLLSGCGVSKDEYNELAAERDALQQQVNEQAESMSAIEDKVQLLENGVDQMTQELAAERSAKEAALAEAESMAMMPPPVTAADISIIREYILPDGSGSFSRHFIVVQNYASAAADIKSTSQAYDAEGNPVGTGTAYSEGIGPGCTTVLVEAVATDQVIDHCETSISAIESNYDSILQNLSPGITDTEKGIEVQITNNGGMTAEHIQGYAMFQKEGNLVSYEEAAIGDDSGQIPSGGTVTKQFSAADYDSCEFYMTGHGDHRW